MTLCILAGLLLVSSPARAQRVEAGAFVTYAFLEEIGSSDHGIGTSTLGIGGRAVWHLAPFVDIDGELAIHPNAGVQGYKVQGVLGAKAGVRWSRLGAFAKVRPGFLYFSKDPFGVGDPGVLPRTDWARSLDPAIDVGAVVEYYTTRGMIVRFDLGDTIVRYHARTVMASQFLPPQQAGGFTTRNRQWSLGLAKRF
jgi:hypothetical protein